MTGPGIAPDTNTGASVATDMEPIACIALFPVLGPAFGLLSLIIASMIENGYQGGSFDPAGFLSVLPLAYIMGVLPAFVTGIFAAFQCSGSLIRRYVLGAVTGFLTSALFPGLFVVSDALHPWLWLWFAAIGAASAVLCLSTVLLLSSGMRVLERHSSRGER